MSRHSSTTATTNEIKCEVVCEDAVLNLPEPANITVTANATKGIAIHKDWSTRFVEAGLETSIEALKATISR